MARVVTLETGKALGLQSELPKEHDDMIDALYDAMYDAFANSEGRCTGEYLLDALEKHNFTLIWQPDTMHPIKPHLVLTDD